MYREWPFFRSLVDNAQIGLGKSDRAIARLYSSLADPAIGPRIFAQVEAEWDRTLGVIEATTGGGLLESSPVLRRSIRLRNPYVDPLSFIQVSLLRRLRSQAAGTSGSEELEWLAGLTINGIAAGLQNTG